MADLAYDLLETITTAISAIQRDVGGVVHRGRNPEGEEVFLHISPEGKGTSVLFSGDPVQDLNILRLMVTPVDVAAES